MPANTEPKLLEPQPVAFHISTADHSALGALFYEITRGMDPRTREVLYLGRVWDASEASGEMLHELPYGSTDPHKMGLWWERTTGEKPPVELSSAVPQEQKEVICP